MDAYDFLIKCVVVGDSGTGKSCIMMRFADDIFNSSYISTIGVDFKINTIEIKNKTVKFQIWDTAGQDRFRTITSSYYRGSQCTIICYDITDRYTFDNVIKWLDEVKKYSTDNSLLVLCGTKIDLEEQRQVQYEEGQTFANTHGMKFIECSSKNNTNIKEIFEYIGETKISGVISNNKDANYYEKNLGKRGKLILEKEVTKGKTTCC
jgi:Ras-related protein Rab-1A